MKPRIGGMKSSVQWIEADLDADVHLFSVTETCSVTVTPDMPRIARLHVTLGGKVRRLEAEPETALRIVPVEQVSYPNFRAPAIPRAARLQVRQDPRRRTLVVRGVEVEIIEPGEVDAREHATRCRIFDAQVELVLRRVRLLAAVEIAIAELIVDVARFEQRATQVQQQRIVGRQRSVASSAVVFAARGVVGEQHEAQGIPRLELLTRRHLLVVAAHVEERDVAGQRAILVGGAQPDLEVVQGFGHEAAMVRGHVGTDVEAAGLVAARERRQ